MLEMESKNHLVLCDKAKQMAKSIMKKVSKGLSTLFMSETHASQQRLLDGTLSSKKASLPLLLEMLVL